MNKVTTEAMVNAAVAAYEAEGRMRVAIEAALATDTSSRFDMLSHLYRQREWSERTFGPGSRTDAIVDHIRKELHEVEAAPDDLEEWIDIVILGLDGAWRTGATPQQIIDGLIAKQTKNEARQWPDWRTIPLGQAIEHHRSDDWAAVELYPI